MKETVICVVLMGSLLSLSGCGDGKEVVSSPAVVVSSNPLKNQSSDNAQDAHTVSDKTDAASVNSPVLKPEPMPAIGGVIEPPLNSPSINGTKTF